MKDGLLCLLNSVNALKEKFITSTVDRTDNNYNTYIIIL